MVWAPIALWTGELTLNPLGFSQLWFQPSSGHVGKPSSAYGWSGGFFFPGSLLFFSPPLMNDWLNISEIFLKGPNKKKQNKKLLNGLKYFDIW